MTPTPRDLIEEAGGPDPARALRAVAALRTLTDRLESLHVQRARDAGWTWHAIGEALGVSRQAVHKKHRKAT